MKLDRVWAELELEGYLVVTSARGDQRQDLAVTGAQPRFARWLGGEQLLPSGWQHGAPRGGVGKRGEYVLGGVALQQDPTRPVLDRAANHLLAGRAAEQHDPGAAARRAEFLHGGAALARAPRRRSRAGARLEDACKSAARNSAAVAKAPSTCSPSWAVSRLAVASRSRRCPPISAIVIAGRGRSRWGRPRHSVGRPGRLPGG